MSSSLRGRTPIYKCLSKNTPVFCGLFRNATDLHNRLMRKISQVKCRKIQYISLYCTFILRLFYESNQKYLFMISAISLCFCVAAMSDK